MGIPDARFTEMVVACIRLRKEWKWSNRSLGHSVVEEKLHLSSDILRQYCIEKSLTGYSSHEKSVSKYACLDTKISSDFLSFGVYFSFMIVCRFKIPKIFVLWKKPFPITSTGKIRRDQVQREVMHHLQFIHSNL